MIANPSALYRGQKLPNREKRVSESKNPHFPPHQKRAFRVKKSPFLQRAPHGNWGFIDSKRPFFGVGGKGGFSTPRPSFPDSGGLWPLYRADGVAIIGTAVGGQPCRQIGDGGSSLSGWRPESLEHVAWSRATARFFFWQATYTWTAQKHRIMTKCPKNVEEEKGT